jgi:TPR repeat protein
MLYIYGVGVPQDPERGRQWLEKAADEGESMAQFNLGVIHEQGLDVSQDYGEAARWYRLAAEQGDAAGQFALGKLHILGKGVPTDYVMAYAWLNLAAAQEYPGASASLAVLSDSMTCEQVGEAQKISREKWNAIHETGSSQQQETTR